MRIQLDRANQLLAEKEIEMENFVQSEHSTLQKLKDQLKVVQEEKKMLQVHIFSFSEIIVYSKYQVKILINFTDTAWYAARTCPIAVTNRYRIS